MTDPIEQRSSIEAAPEQPEFLASPQMVYRFVLPLMLTAAAVVVIGWYTDFRDTMHYSLISILIAAFLPFVMICAVIATGIIIAVIAAIVGGCSDGSSIVEVVFLLSRTIVPYYRFLASRRHPTFWAIPFGCVAGGLLLWGLIALVILPGEARTSRIILQTQRALQEVYDQEHDFPRPDENGHLLRSDIGAPQGAGEPKQVTDGFGRPLIYEHRGKWKFQSYQLRSLGFDGEPGRDDFCSSGGTKVTELAGRAADIFKFVTLEINGKELGIAERLDAVRTLHCKD